MPPPRLPWARASLPVRPLDWMVAPMTYDDDLAPDERGHDCAGSPCPFCEQMVATITVTRVITNDGSMRDDVDVDDGLGGSIELATAVGMLAVAQHQMLSEGL